MVPVCGKLICCVCWDGVGVQGICGVSTARRRLHNMGGHRAHRAWNDRREAHQRRYRSSDFVPQNRQLETDDLASKTKSRFLPARYCNIKAAKMRVGKEQHVLKCVLSVCSLRPS